MLEVRDLDVSYGDFQVVWGIDLTVGPSEVVCILGPNGAGKSSVLNAITGLAPRQASAITFGDADLLRIPTYEIARRGIAHVLERRRLFPTLTVRQNLLLGAYNPDAKRHRAETLAWVETLFPFLEDRHNSPARVLSGGQQQMVAIARGLMSRPRLLMIDEPFLGLSPLMVDEIRTVITRINADGVAILFNEQNVELALSLSHRGYLLESGRVVLTGTGEEMLGSDLVRTVYLGV
ncbi:MAG: ABC transporter ATP-binding protein [Alphaproteobacteria bacterium]|nr:ABC transporter ATP-binding protein [Alphaproteobacteria bacterium]MCZ6588309.1 ABC transporter ATP-binding protein [Alphaproteobacteria bacterium]